MGFKHLMSGISGWSFPPEVFILQVISMLLFVNYSNLAGKAISKFTFPKEGDDMLSATLLSHSQLIQRCILSEPHPQMISFVDVLFLLLLSLLNLI